MEKLTKEIIKGWSYSEMLRKMGNPETRVEIERVANENPELINEVVANQPEVPVSPTLEEDIAATEAAAAVSLAAAATEVQASAKAVADKAEADRKAVEADELKAAGISIEYDANEKIVKIIQSYQSRDEQGNPVGRPTYLESRNWIEHATKQRSAHENATRYAERLKKQKTTFKKEESGPTSEQVAAQQAETVENLSSEDPKVKAAAVRQIADDAVEVQRKKTEAAEARAEGARVSYEWMRKHIHDFNPCEANSKILSEYISNNGLEWTADNLELAFMATESQLAPAQTPQPVVQVSAPPPAANLPVVPATPVAVVPVPAPQPVAVPTPVPPVAPAIPVQSVPRPGVNAGLVPGTTNAGRPTAQTTTLTKADIAKWTALEMRKQMKDPKVIAQMKALGIGFVGVTSTR